MDVVIVGSQALPRGQCNCFGKWWDVAVGLRGMLLCLDEWTLLAFMNIQIQDRNIPCHITMQTQNNQVSDRKKLEKVRIEGHSFNHPLKNTPPEPPFSNSHPSKST
jgi:hypothetical protein